MKKPNSIPAGTKGMTPNKMQRRPVEGKPSKTVPVKKQMNKPRGK